MFSLFSRVEIQYSRFSRRKCLAHCPFPLLSTEHAWDQIQQVEYTTLSQPSWLDCWFIYCYILNSWSKNYFLFKNQISKYVNVIFCHQSLLKNTKSPEEERGIWGWNGITHRLFVSSTMIGCWYFYCSSFIHEFVTLIS